MALLVIKLIIKLMKHFLESHCELKAMELRIHFWVKMWGYFINLIITSCLIILKMIL